MLPPPHLKKKKNNNNAETSDQLSSKGVKISGTCPWGSISGTISSRDLLCIFCKKLWLLLCISPQSYSVVMVWFLSTLCSNRLLNTFEKVLITCIKDKYFIWRKILWCSMQFCNIHKVQFLPYNCLSLYTIYIFKHSLQTLV